MLFYRFLEKSVVYFGNKPALLCHESQLSYRELDAEASRVARGLQAWGVQPGDRVAVWLPNSVELIVILWAVLKLGAVFVPIHPLTRLVRLVRILEDGQVAALFMPGWAKDKAPNLLQTQSNLQLVVLCGRSASDADCVGFRMTIYERLGLGVPELKNVVEETADAAALIYTFNVGGKPRGTVLNHRNLVFAVDSLIEIEGNNSQDRLGMMLPLSSVDTICQVLATFRSGGTVVLERGSDYPAVVLRWMERQQVTVMHGSPSLFNVILQMDPRQFDCSSLRCLINSETMLPVRDVERLHRAFPQAEFHAFYRFPQETFYRADYTEERGRTYGEWSTSQGGARIPSSIEVSVH